ncbi:MAG: hypothetical protein FWD35_03385 [Oscillospiraceae bacterium]|nr:hypothetical protein [Oscillospiraceae bacterium]
MGKHMELPQWVLYERSQDEKLDVFWQIVLFVREQLQSGILPELFPKLFAADENNDIRFVGNDSVGTAPAKFDLEKEAVFSLGLLLNWLLEGGTPPQPNVSHGNRGSRLRKSKYPDGSAVRAKDSGAISLLTERMTAYDPAARPAIKIVVETLNAGICKFSIVLENELSGQIHTEITRSFSASESFKFIPESGYNVGGVSLRSAAVEPLRIPFRLVKKEYVLKVRYGANGRWGRDVPEEFEGDTLFCKTDGYSYEMSFYDYERGEITLTRQGQIAVPERLEARINSLLREAGRTPANLFCVGVSGLNRSETCSEAITAINDAFPESVKIYYLSNQNQAEVTV